jgi:hypothetical protein
VKGSISAAKVNVNGSYQVFCDYGVLTNAIDMNYELAPSAASTCRYTKYSGTVYQFDCVAGAVPGTYPISCSMANIAPDKYCAQTNAVGSIVIGAVAPAPTPTPVPPAAGNNVCVSAAEHSTANIACPQGQTIASVTYANYGLTSGACGAYVKGSCSASNSLSVVQSACLNKASCAVDANNTPFGDPCSGTQKSLVVQVKCSGGTSATPTPTPKPTATPTPKPTATPAPPPANACAPAPSSSSVINVMDKGAKGNGSSNDTAAIQAAITQVAGSGGTVLVPAGTYMVDATKSLQLGSNMTFKMDAGAILKVITNGADSYNVLYVNGKTNVNIVGGTIQGDRASHTSTSGEWGMGVNVSNSSNVVVEKITVRDLWGDGVYIGYASKNTTFCSVIADNNRRQGMSIVSVSGVVVKDSTFKNTNGANPMAGIDIEPNENDIAENITITNSLFTGNKNSGLLVWSVLGTVRNVNFSNNTVKGNMDYGIYNNGADNSKFQNNVINEAWGGIFLETGVTGNTVSGNDITAPANRVITDNGSGNTISGNTSH